MTSNTAFPYKTVLMLGATSGIGLALAEKMIQNGIYVIAVGRRKEKLESFVSKHGKDKVSTLPFDVTDLGDIPSFAETFVSPPLSMFTPLVYSESRVNKNIRVTKAHPKLDSVIINSGIQRSLDFTQPQDIDLEVVQAEYTTNYIAPLHITKAFLPFLQNQSLPTSLIFTTSGLALTPITRCPGYCATKAAMHHMILVLREQLKGSNVKIVEILPPAVQTELHDAKHQPDIKDGEQMGMPLEEFTDECWEGLEGGKENVPVGMAKRAWPWEEERIKRFEKMVEMMKPKM